MWFHRVLGSKPPICQYLQGLGPEQESNVLPILAGKGDKNQDPYLEGATSRISRILILSHWAHEVFFFANVFIIHLVLCRRCRIRPKGTADRHATQQRPNSTSGATTGRYVPSEGIPAPQYDHSMFAASAKPWPRSAILAHTSAQSRVEKLETRRTLCVAWRGSKDHHQSDLCRTHEQRLSRCNGGGCT